jgi:hypothetical protein
MSDFQITDQGTIILIRPLNAAARQWLDENVISEPWQWVQGALCVEARFARDIIIEIEEAGFEVTRRSAPHPTQPRAAWGEASESPALRSRQRGARTISAHPFNGCQERVTAGGAARTRRTPAVPPSRPGTAAVRTGTGRHQRIG